VKLVKVVFILEQNNPF